MSDLLPLLIFKVSSLLMEMLLIMKKNEPKYFTQCFNYLYLAVRLYIQLDVMYFTALT